MEEVILGTIMTKIQDGEEVNDIYENLGYSKGHQYSNG